MEKMKFETPDMAQMNVEKIAALFPNCVTESKAKDGKLKKAVNFDALKQMLGESVAEGDESYEFTWVGKRDAMVEAAKPIRKTLRPCVEESKNFDTTENLYIEGDNLEALKLLQEGYLGKVKMIYIDPPYNTGNDFIYKDDFRMDSAKYAEESGAVDDEGNRMVQNSDSNGRFHSDWCSMIYSRLLLARNLLTDDGVIFISIDDNEQENLKKICDDVFCENNYVGKIAVVNNLKGRNSKKDIATCHEYVIVYGKSEFSAGGMPLSEEQRALYDKIDENGNRYQLRDLRKRGGPDKREDRPNMYFVIYYNNETKECSLDYHEGWIKILPQKGDGSDGRWRWGKERVSMNLKILEPFYSEIAGRWGIRHRVYLNSNLNSSFGDEESDEVEERNSKSKSFWMGAEFSGDIGRRQIKELFGTPFFDYPKSIDYILNTLYMGSCNDSIILDFFSGSATTAHAVMQLNAEDGGHRKFIMVQLPEQCDENSEAAKAGYKTICEIGKERIRRAGDKILAEQQANEKSAADKTDLFDSTSDKPAAAKPLDIGFRVLKIDDSNMKDVYYSAGEISQQDLVEQISNIKDGRTDMDLLFGCLVDWGVPLSLPIKTETIEKLQVYNVNDGDLVACFANDIPEAAIRQIAAAKPLRAVFRDSSFKSDSAKINVTEIFKTISPNTTVKVV
jgi:adenine-specific DNA-methyltransferase